MIRQIETTIDELIAWYVKDQNWQNKLPEATAGAYSQDDADLLWQNKTIAIVATQTMRDGYFVIKFALAHKAFELDSIEEPFRS